MKRGAIHPSPPRPPPPSCLLWFSPLLAILQRAFPKSAYVLDPKSVPSPLQQILAQNLCVTRLSAETHRQAKHFKRCVYISLPRWSSSIKLDIVEAMDVETDTSSAEEIDVEPSDFPDREPSPDFPEPADLLPEEPSDDISSTIVDVARLTLNITKPDEDLPATAPEPYARAAAHLPNVLRQLERVKSTIESSSWTPAHLFDLAQDLLFPALALLVDFGDLNTEDGQAQFTSEFCLGPFGLAPFIDLLHRFYVLTINWKARLPHVEIQGFVSVLNSFSTPIYAALLHFRSTIPRTSYDPAGFSTLREVLQKHGYKFGVRSHLSIFYLITS
ncbi:hypothetical protein B0H13DRAFT_2319866 [Mycena leptocephala]|nr:hypothetical protein B0H13DRAFT_2319866 [Mycena leptocephala]